MNDRESTVVVEKTTLKILDFLQMPACVRNTQVHIKGPLATILWPLCFCAVPTNSLLE